MEVIQKAFAKESIIFGGWRVMYGCFWNLYGKKLGKALNTILCNSSVLVVEKGYQTGFCKQITSVSKKYSVVDVPLHHVRVKLNMASVGFRPAA